MANDGVLRAGYLTKSPPLDRGFFSSVKRWKNRWFVLRTSNKLDYFTDDTEKEWLGTIDLSECDSIDAGLVNKRGKRLFDVVTKTRTFYLEARSEKEEEEWVKILCERCGFTLEETDNTARSATLTQEEGKTPKSVKKGLTRASTMPAIRSGRRHSSDEFKQELTENQEQDIPALQCQFTPKACHDIPISQDSGIVIGENSPEDESTLSRDHTMDKSSADDSPNSDSPPNTRKPGCSDPITIPGGTPRTRQRLSDEIELDPSAASSPPMRPPKSMSFSEQQPESKGYATLTADFKPPGVDRSKKPSHSSPDVVPDPDAPPIDRSRKPTGPLIVSAPISMESPSSFQLPEATAATRRYSKHGVLYAIPPGSITMVAVSAHSLPQGVYSVPPTLNRSISSPTHQNMGPSANYDYPPSHSVSRPSANYDYPPSHSVPRPSANYDYPPPPRPANYDYPPSLPGGPHRLQRSMSMTPACHAQQRASGPADNYSYPPTPVPANMASSHPIPIGSQSMRQSCTSINSRVSTSSYTSQGSHQSHSGMFSMDSNDGGDYLFTEVQGDETGECYEYMEPGVMAGNRSAPTRPPKPSV